MGKVIIPLATTAELSGITPDEGEVVFDEDKDTLFIGDGATAGGKSPVTPDALKGYSEAIPAQSATGAVTVDFNNSNVHRLNLTGNVTSLTISNWPANHAKLTLYILQDSVVRTFTWPAGIKWAASAPALGTASQWTTVVLSSIDGGTTIFGMVPIDDVA
jgi:hypothetical protein